MVLRTDLDGDHLWLRRYVVFIGDVPNGSSHSEDPLDSHDLSNGDHPAFLLNDPLILIDSRRYLFTSQLKHLIVSDEYGRWVSQIGDGQLTVDDQRHQARGPICQLRMSRDVQELVVYLFEDYVEMCKFQILKWYGLVDLKRLMNLLNEI